MSSIALFAASDLEFRAFQSFLTRRQATNANEIAGWHGENRITLFRTEMGPKNAARQAAQALSKQDISAVLVSGLAGALMPQCRSGDIVLYRHCFYSEIAPVEGSSLGCSANLTDMLSERLHARQFTVHEGAGLTVPNIMCKAADKRRAGEHYRALAVDMESYQIVNAARVRGIEAAVLRIISDDAHHDLPDLNAGLDAHNGVNNFKMVMSLAAHPLLSTRFLINLWRSMARLKSALEFVLDESLAPLITSAH